MEVGATIKKVTKRRAEDNRFIIQSRSVFSQKMPDLDLPERHY